MAKQKNPLNAQLAAQQQHMKQLRLLLNQQKIQKLNNQISSQQQKNQKAALKQLPKAKIYRFPKAQVYKQPKQPKWGAKYSAVAQSLGGVGQMTGQAFFGQIGNVFRGFANLLNGLQKLFSVKPSAPLGTPANIPVAKPPIYVPTQLARQQAQPNQPGAPSLQSPSPQPVMGVPLANTGKTSLATKPTLLSHTQVISQNSNLNISQQYPVGSAKQVATGGGGGVGGGRENLLPVLQQVLEVLKSIDAKVGNQESESQENVHHGEGAGRRSGAGNIRENQPPVSPEPFTSSSMPRATSHGRRAGVATMVGQAAGSRMAAGIARFLFGG